MAVAPRLTLVIPAYREQAVLGATLAAARRVLAQCAGGYEILVAVDGEDGTAAVAAAHAAEDPAVEVLAWPTRRGKGRAVREAVARARGEVIGFLDADGKVAVEEVVRALSLLGQGCDVVVGSRRGEGARVAAGRPLHRRLGSRAFSAAVRRLLPGLRGIPDTQCGLKLFRREAARDLFARQRVDGYMFDVEVLLLAVRAGYRLEQMGVSWRDDGDSRLELLRGNFRNLRDLLSIRRNASKSTNSRSSGAERNA